MIVDAGKLADFPADGHTFEEVVFENEIACVAAFGEEKIFFERFGADVILDDEGLDVFDGELFGGNGGEILDPVGDGELGGGEIVGHEVPPGNYNERKEACGAPTGLATNQQVTAAPTRWGNVWRAYGARARKRARWV